MASRQPLCENYLLPRLDRSSLSRITYTLLKYNTQIERYYRSAKKEFHPSFSFFFPFPPPFSFFSLPSAPFFRNDQLPLNFHNCSDKMITRSVWIPSLSANSSALFEDSPFFKGFLVDPCSHPSASALSSSGARSFDPFASSSLAFVPPNADTATVVVDVVTVLAIALFDGTLPSKFEYAVPPRASYGSKSQRVSEYLGGGRRSLLPC